MSQNACKTIIITSSKGFLKNTIIYYARIGISAGSAVDLGRLLQHLDLKHSISFALYLSLNKRM